MTTHELFEKHHDEFLKFDRVEPKLASRPDVHAFIALDKLFPRKRDLVCCAEHDEIWLDVKADEVTQLTEPQIIELTRCGVRFDSNTESLAMFV